MSDFLECPCGSRTAWDRRLTADGLRCLNCGRDLAEAAAQRQFAETKRNASPPSVHWSYRMGAALLDPRSIQMMFTVGGGLMVIGLLIWLAGTGLFNNKLVAAATLTLGSLAIHASGCWVVLKTRFAAAGKALAFLGCLLIPLNLWFYHAQNLLTLDGRLWIAGVACCLVYAATVILLRDPLFLFAVEGGVTLTVILLLGQLGLAMNPAWVAAALLVLALVSIHAERVFPPESEEPWFHRVRFGLPLFAAGHVQLIGAIAFACGGRTLAFLERAGGFDTLTGRPLFADPLLMGVFAAATYIYLYSDFVVRRKGWYCYAAAVTLTAAQFAAIDCYLPREWMIVAPAATAALVMLAVKRDGTSGRMSDRIVVPASMLGFIAFLGVIALHMAILVLRSASGIATGPDLRTSCAVFFAAAICLQATALCAPIAARGTRFGLRTAAGCTLLAAISALLTAGGIDSLEYRLPIMLLLPAAAIVATAIETSDGETKSNTLAPWLIGFVLLHIPVIALPLAMLHGRELPSIMFGSTLAEAAVLFGAIAFGLGARRWLAGAIAAACGAVWCFAFGLGAAEAAFAPLFAALGIAMLFTGRVVRGPAESEQRYRLETDMLLGAGHAVLILALLSGAFQSAVRWFAHGADAAMLGTMGASFAFALAAAIVTTDRACRRFFGTIALAIGVELCGVTYGVLDLTPWRKIELLAVLGGFIVLLAAYVGRFLERTRDQADMVSLGLLLGSIIPVTALASGAIHERFMIGAVSLPDELALVALASFMLVTGCGWQLRAPVIVGGTALGGYVAVVLCSLAYFPNAAMGVYLAIGGGGLFTVGLLLSLFRDRLVKLPQSISEREGVFQVLNWR